MKRLVAVFMMFFLMLGVCGAPRLALAQDNETAAANEVYGTVTFVDPQAQKLIVVSASDEGQKETALIVDDSTMIEKDGKAATLVDVATGDDVTASYKAADNGQNVAASISASSQQ
ncbi:hypothetical protein BU251_08580 [Candidatus Velamenicoccus archaeovorus]|uniref:DUF5666 domain-containing protein n=1 Tax=Velamenicoccus archaeovorus TaxID=1930593 RepID=A0A410P6R6_VELA1|nr:hypothetical protein [Candidatus Velamenicoccus archaeovorus]QAT17771.1 hypothetical protein BU251_08580 [Candidatus Velamenicoccus archaeovorus]